MPTNQAFMIMMLTAGLTNHVMIIPVLLEKSGRDAWITIIVSAVCIRRLHDTFIEQRQHVAFRNDSVRRSRNGTHRQSRCGGLECGGATTQERGQRRLKIGDCADLSEFRSSVDVLLDAVEDIVAVFEEGAVITAAATSQIGRWVLGGLDDGGR